MEDILNNINKQKIDLLSQMLNKLSPTELVTLGTIIAIILCEYLSPNQQNTLGNFLEMIGQVLLTSYAQATSSIPQYIPISVCDFETFEKEILNLIKNYANK